MLAVAPAVALGASADRAASEAYVRANYALVRAGHAKMGTAEASLQDLLASIRRECPHIVAGSPQDEDSEKLTWELVAAMRIVVSTPSRARSARSRAACARCTGATPALTRSRARLRAQTECRGDDERAGLLRGAAGVEGQRLHRAARRNATLLNACYPV